MSNENLSSKPSAEELDIGIDTLFVLGRTVHIRKSGDSWPKSLASSLKFEAYRRVTNEVNSLLVATYYGGFLDNIKDAEEIINGGPGSDLIFAWTHDVVEQAEYFIEVQDEQLSAMQSLMEDPTGIKLLTMKLSSFTSKAQGLDQKVVEGINSLISETKDFREISWETVEIPRDDNLRAFTYMRAFDDYRRFWIHLEDKFTLIDSIIEEDQ